MRWPIIVVEIVGAGFVKKFVVYAVVLGAMIGGPASAQETETYEGDGVYMRVGAGVGFVRDWRQDYTFNPNVVTLVPNPTEQWVANGRGLIAAAALGFDYADGIRTELEYRYSSSDIESVTQSAFGGRNILTPANDHIRAHFIMSNFYIDLTNSSPVTPFFGGGVGGALVENENGNKDGALAYQGRAGLSLDLGGGLSTDVEYVYLGTNKLAFGPKDDDFTPTGPAGPRLDDARYQSSSVMVSFRKLF